ncbi:MAG: lysophospholipid acyltransferase family protein [Candidatus Pelagibacter bacterium]|jgi:1-acyl-sn-glycerol-3-phosphate acyltransferase|nr:lysophospholipid acyltransferase family protein [Candidatus Pelagibacter bacterium]
MIRSLIFRIFFYLGIILISLIFLPSLLLPQKIVLFGGKIMGHWSKICLNIFLSTKIIIKGKENIISEGKFFIACSHQSMFETFFLQTIFNSPVFILKKELLRIPVFGMYLKKIGSISIDRNKISKENLGFSDKIKSVINSSNRPIIIFPQATRMAPEDRAPFKKGVSRIYEDLQIKCQPVAINSGNIWPKSGKLKSNGILVISILKEIEPKIDSKDFLNILQNNIYQELDKIV